MLYAALSIGIITLIVSLGLLGAFAVRLSRQSVEIACTMSDAHSRTLQTLEKIHDRNMAQVSELADRFMSLDFATFKSYQLAGSAEEGEFIEPEGSGGGELRVERQLPGGRVAVLGADLEARLAAAANERKLLSEDFPEEWDS